MIVNVNLQSCSVSQLKRRVSVSVYLSRDETGLLIMACIYYDVSTCYSGRGILFLI